jgi:hypothetical protein
MQYHGTTLRGGRTAHWEIDHLRSNVWRSTAINDKKLKTTASDTEIKAPVTVREDHKLGQDG